MKKKKKTEKICYDEYHFSVKERVRYFLEASAIILSVSYFFYQSVIPIFIGILCIPPYFKKKKRMCIRKRKEKMKLRFKDAIAAFSNALLVGYSVENAFVEAYEDLKLMYEEEEEFMKEFQFMIHQLKNNAVLETLLLDFANRVQISDVMDFAQVFSVAKRSGGNISGMMQQAVKTISDKMEVKREIKTILAAKQFEQRIMNLIPIAIVAYIHITSPNYFDVLYGNVAGVFVMTACLLLYLIALLLAEKITGIEVE